MNIKEQIIELLEKVGIFVELQEQDIDLREYGLDSISYITLICDIECCFGVEVPAEYLSINETVSLNTITKLISELIDQ